MKHLYVRTVHVLRDGLDRSGLLRALDAWATRSRAGSWARSLLAIHDVEALVRLDTPWWTFESAGIVADHLAQRPAARVFEWGSGASTVWLSRRASEVVAVEHDASWAERVRHVVGPDVDVVTVEPRPAPPGTGIRSHKRGHEDLDFAAYVEAIGMMSGEFDLIVIDGRAREACLGAAIPRLAPGGLVVFDNVDRRRYREAISAHPGLEVLTTRGLTPCLPYPTRTALIRSVPGS